MSDDHKFDFDGIKYRIESRPPLIFIVLCAGLLAWGVAFMGYFLFSGWSSEAEYAQEKRSRELLLAAQKPAAPPAGKLSEQALAAEGGKIYAERCAACHGADAKGKIGPDLVHKEYKYGRSPEAIRQSIADGRPGGMPSFKNDLSAEKIEGLVAYLLSL
jgi:cytochrome c oxidase cbb3-type subunit III